MEEIFKEKCCKLCGQVKFMGTMTKWPVFKFEFVKDVFIQIF